MSTPQTDTEAEHWSALVREERVKYPGPRIPDPLFIGGYSLRDRWWMKSTMRRLGLVLPAGTSARSMGDGVTIVSARSASMAFLGMEPRGVNAGIDISWENGERGGAGMTCRVKLSYAIRGKFDLPDDGLSDEWKDFLWMLFRGEDATVHLDALAALGSRVIVDDERGFTLSQALFSVTLNGFGRCCSTRPDGRYVNGAGETAKWNSLFPDRRSVAEDDIAAWAEKGELDLRDSPFF